MSTAKENIEVFQNGSLLTQVFLAVSVCTGLYIFFMQDWTPLERIRIQSPNTFVSEQQPGISLAAIANVHFHITKAKFYEGLLRFLC